MNLKSGYPFWLIKDGLPFTYNQLSQNISTDVLIMGGGISGALVAWQLIKNGIACVVADARTIGLGSSCASTSLLQYEIDTPLSILQKKVGVQQAVRSYELCKKAIYDLGDIAADIGFVDFQYKQSLYYAAYKKDENFLMEEHAVRKKYGFEVRFLNRKELKKEFEFDAPAAILSADGAQTNAYQFAHQLLQAGIKKGLKVYDRTRIVNIEHQQKKVIVTTEKGHIITAKKMVYANGYEVVNYIKKSIVRLHSTYVTISENIENKRPFWKEDVLIWNTADPYLYLRTTSDNRIIVGGRDEDFFSPAKRDQLISIKAKQLSNDFKKLFPLQEFKPEFNWAGTFGSTKDGLPFIGKYPSLTNSYFSLGFGGNGITFASLLLKLFLTKLIIRPARMRLFFPLTGHKATVVRNLFGYLKLAIKFYAKSLTILYSLHLSIFVPGK